MVQYDRLKEGEGESCLMGQKYEQIWASNDQWLDNVSYLHNLCCYFPLATYQADFPCLKCVSIAHHFA